MSTMSSPGRSWCHLTTRMHSDVINLKILHPSHSSPFSLHFFFYVGAIYLMYNRRSRMKKNEKCFAFIYTSPTVIINCANIFSPTLSLNFFIWNSQLEHFYLIYPFSKKHFGKPGANLSLGVVSVHK